MKLKISHDIDFQLIGIQSEMKDYQFAYFLNRSTLFMFKRMIKDISYMINSKKIYFSAFEHREIDLRRSSFLIKNQAFYSQPVNNALNLFNETRIKQSTFLIPELKEFNYFMKFVGIWKKEELLEQKKFLTNLPGIHSPTNIDVSRIKSITNLIF
ncbi:MAG: hypothetical protein CMP62_00335 [Flavobacteriales bacterium]|nr:hypothetical protein [Flavobacteriales bacterium]